MLRKPFLLLMLVFVFMPFTPATGQDIDVQDIVTFYVTVPNPPDIAYIDLPPDTGFVLKQVFTGEDGDHITFYENDVPRTMINANTYDFTIDLGVSFEQGSTIGLGAWTRSQNVTIIGYKYSHDFELNGVYSFYVTIPAPPGTVDIQLNEGTGFILKEAFTGRGTEQINISENGIIKTSMNIGGEYHTKWDSDLGIPFKRGSTITLSAETEEQAVTFIGYKY